MNKTVERIVNLLFDNVEMTEETLAMRDEVMNNCQDRFASLVADGYAEDDAVAAVVESLNGMDEVLKDYPRKQAPDAGFFDKDDAAQAHFEGTTVIAWDQIRHLRVNVRSAEVEVSETEGRQTVEVQAGSHSYIDLRVDGDTLVATQKNRAAASEAPNESGLLGSLARLFRGAVSLGDDSCRLSLGLPAGMLESARIQTFSGDVAFSLPAPEVSIQTTSGDVDVSVASDSTKAAVGGERAGKMAVVTVSGDLDVRGEFARADMTTTSGDVDYRGTADQLTITTVSGDVEAESCSARISVSVVSGDVDLTLTSPGPAEVKAASVSGDVEIRLADPAAGACASFRTKTGDVTWHSGARSNPDAPVRLDISTISGDIGIG